MIHQRFLGLKKLLTCLLLLAMFMPVSVWGGSFKTNMETNYPTTVATNANLTVIATNFFTNYLTKYLPTNETNFDTNDSDYIKNILPTIFNNIYALQNIDSTPNAPAPVKSFVAALSALCDKTEALNCKQLNKQMIPFIKALLEKKWQDLSSKTAPTWTPIKADIKNLKAHKLLSETISPESSSSPSDSSTLDESIAASLAASQAASSSSASSSLPPPLPSSGSSEPTSSAISTTPTAPPEPPATSSTTSTTTTETSLSTTTSSSTPPSTSSTPTPLPAKSSTLPSSTTSTPTEVPTPKPVTLPATTTTAPTTLPPPLTTKTTATSTPPTPSSSSTPPTPTPASKTVTDAEVIKLLDDVNKNFDAFTKKLDDFKLPTGAADTKGLETLKTDITAGLKGLVVDFAMHAEDVLVKKAKVDAEITKIKAELAEATTTHATEKNAATAKYAALETKNTDLETKHKTEIDDLNTKLTEAQKATAAETAKAEPAEVIKSEAAIKAFATALQLPEGAEYKNIESIKTAFKTEAAKTAVVKLKLADTEWLTEEKSKSILELIFGYTKTAAATEGAAATFKDDTTDVTEITFNQDFVDTKLKPLLQNIITMHKLFIDPAGNDGAGIWVMEPEDFLTKESTGLLAQSKPLDAIVKALATNPTFIGLTAETAKAKTLKLVDLGTNLGKLLANVAAVSTEIGAKDADWLKAGTEADAPAAKAAKAAKKTELAAAALAKTKAEAELTTAKAELDALKTKAPAPTPALLTAPAEKEEIASLKTLLNEQKNSAQTAASDATVALAAKEKELKEAADKDIAAAKEQHAKELVAKEKELKEAADKKLATAKEQHATELKAAQEKAVPVPASEAVEAAKVAAIKSASEAVAHIFTNIAANIQIKEPMIQGTLANLFPEDPVSALVGVKGLLEETLTADIKKAVEEFNTAKKETTAKYDELNDNEIKPAIVMIESDIKALGTIKKPETKNRRLVTIIKTCHDAAGSAQRAARLIKPYDLVKYIEMKNTEFDLIVKAYENAKVHNSDHEPIGEAPRVSLALKDAADIVYAYPAGKTTEIAAQATKLLTAVTALKEVTKVAEDEKSKKLDANIDKILKLPNVKALTPAPTTN